MNRLRVRDNRSLQSHKVEVMVYDRYPSCGNALAWRGPIASQTWNLHSGKLSTMRDSVVPGYHRRSAAGEVFFNPCYSVEIDISAPSGGNAEVMTPTLSCSAPNQYNWRGKHNFFGSVGRATCGFGYTVLSDGFLSPPPYFCSASDVSALRTEVSTACLSNIGRADSNLYESLAEANQMLGTLPSIFKQGLAVASSRGFGKVKNAANAYLALRYGLMPVMSDVESILLGLNSTTGRVRRSYRSQGSIQTTKVDVNNAYSYAAAYNCKQTFTHNETITVRAMSLCEYYASVMSNIGFTTKGLLTLPWELVPYSFVVDWFINVGDFLGSLAPDANMTQLGSCLVEKREITSNYDLSTLSGQGGNVVVTPVSGSANRVVRTYMRTPGPLVSGVVLKSDFRLSNLTRATDALALLVQKLR